ncbi:TetR family transcriptional regulator [Brevibacillus sp. B_LB10_24]|uniref:TetR family transcriptional regulator n=1 Tax=Brevibacillus sp. B_LB10_24 TaxID=3380645 RepID=UPI0038BA493D
MRTAQNEKYERLVEAAKRMIAQKGLEKTTVSDIVKEAGVAQGTFYLYFASKNAVVFAIAMEHLNQLFSHIKEKGATAGSFFDLLTIMIDETFAVTERTRDVLVLCYSGFAIENAFDKWEQIYDPYYQWLEGQFANAKKSGEVRAELDSAQTVRMMINLIEITAERLYLSKEKDISAPDLKEKLLSFIRHAVGSGR